MFKMKKLLSGLLALMLVVMMVPVTANAATLTLAPTTLLSGEYVLGNSLSLTEPIEIPAGNTVTIDLNGFDITMVGFRNPENTQHYYAINNYGTLTIKGNGTISGRGAAQNFGTMTVESGTLLAIDTDGGAAIWNEGTLTVNGGTLTTVDSNNTNSGPGALNVNAGNATLNGGTFISNADRTYAVISNGTLTVKEGVSITGKHGALGIVGGTTTVDGGVMTLLGSSNSDHILYVVNGATLINNGGEYINQSQGTAGDSGVWIETGSNATINGGTFPQEDQETVEEYVPDGIEKVDNGDGTFTIINPYVSNGPAPATVFPKGCDHVMDYIITKQPTETEDGLIMYKCTKCNHATHSIKIGGHGVFLKNAAKAILNAKPGANVVIDTDRYMSFNTEVFEAIKARTDVTVTVNYVYRGAEAKENRSFTVAGGTDLTPFLGEEGFCGFEYIVYQLALAAMK